MSAFWRERFTSPARLALILLLWGVPVVLALTGGPIVPPTDVATIFLYMILGAGVIERGALSGTPRPGAARPTSPTVYVVSRWLALGSACFGLALLGLLIVLPFMLSAGAQALPDFLWLLGDQFFVALGAAAVLTGVSALLPGVGGMALWFAAYVVSGQLLLTAPIASLGWLRRLIGEV